MIVEHLERIRNTAIQPPEITVSEEDRRLLSVPDLEVPEAVRRLLELED